MSHQSKSILSPKQPLFAVQVVEEAIPIFPGNYASHPTCPVALRWKQPCYPIPLSPAVLW